jgi:ATP-dependent DNA helicase RecQ
MRRTTGEVSGAGESAVRNQLEETLSGVFGFREFRPNQEGIVRAVLDGRDVFAVMPTGGGKSLCYQLPARMRDGTAVVISPLISLMKDQVDAARANGLAAEFLNSTLAPPERRRVRDELARGAVELLYLAPERLALGGFLEELSDVPLSLFAVDEAHCISEWGHDFRPDYLGLSEIKRLFPRVPLAAFTATATPRVQAEVIDRLGLRSPFVVRASFNRPNLFLEVRRKEKVREQLLEFLGRRPGESGIVYRTTRKSVEATAAFLESAGVDARPYHAGLPDEQRRATQEAFKSDKLDVVVATIAFGMGIDKPNVRFVVHADLPRNVEGYYQEIGRAGRDGEAAHCLLLFSRADASRLLYFIDEIENPRERRAALDKLERMVEYAANPVCRRREILAYFGEEFPEEDCAGCDVCAGEYRRVRATDDARVLLSAIVRTGQRFGAKHVIEVVAGADTKRIRDFGHDRLKIFGAGGDKSRRHWGRVLDELLSRGALRQAGGRYPTLALTPEGAALLRGETEFQMLERKRPGRPAAPGPATPVNGREVRPAQSDADCNPRLYERLRALRLRLADERGVAAFVILHNRTLREICRKLPTGRTQLAAITGIGEAKLERYGDVLLEEVRRHLAAEPGS